MAKDPITGLASQIKGKLIQQALERKIKRIENAVHTTATEETSGDIPEAHYKFELHPGYTQLRIIHEGAMRLGIDSPFFRIHEGIAGATTQIAGKSFINFASYNYLGLNGDCRVNAAAKAAIDRYGVSVSASRLVSGERPFHRELETAITQAYGVDDTITFVSGHATNVSTIGMLFGARDLVLHDELIHNSALQGILLSGAKRFAFRHNDCASLEELLHAHRRNFERVLIIVEGIYSMDGDFPDLPRMIELKTRYKAFLMVDEAHSFGVMGKTGLGIREHFALDGREVDIWMGTLSKTLAACGGYISGGHALIEHLKFLAPGFLYSVGMPAPVAASAVAAFKCLRAEPERVHRLQNLGQYFLREANARGINTGASAGYAVIPAITGGSIKAARLSSALFDAGINVQPILYPAVPEKSARLRFFISSEHTHEQIDETLDVLGRAWNNY